MNDSDPPDKYSKLKPPLKAQLNLWLGRKPTAQIGGTVEILLGNTRHSVEFAAIAQLGRGGCLENPIITGVDVKPELPEGLTLFDVQAEIINQLDIPGPVERFRAKEDLVTDKPVDGVFSPDV